MTSFKTPTPLQIDTAVQRMTSPDFAAYFLSRLENPQWIEPLLEKGFFASPPPVLTEGVGSSNPHWPASKYLARMAARAPQEVAQVFAGIETDNSSVIYDMLEAALAMPPDAAVTLVPVVSRASRDRLLWIGFKEASDLCVQLAEADELDASLELADALFTPTAEDEDRHSRRDDYWYIEGLEKVVASLAKVRPQEFLPRLCNWLQAAVEAKKFSNQKTGDDYSHTWRPAVEEHPENRDYEFAGQLVGCVREGFEQAVFSKQMSLTDSLKILDRYSYLIYKRIQIHLVNEFAEDNVDLACQTIMDRTLFDDYRTKHEYAMLVGQRLDLLSPQQREEWFGWIDAGPDMSDIDESIQKNLDRESREEDRQNRIQYWQYEKLHWIKDHLEGERTDFYDQMLKKHGPPKFADMYTTSMRYGDESPMTVEELAALSFEQAVNKVSTWQSEKNDPWGPNVTGLAATFTHYVATSPEEFSKQAEILIDRPPIFVRSFLGQMSESVKAGHNIEIPEVLKLGEWVVEQPATKNTESDEDDGDMVDTDWRWSRNQISELLQNVCRAKTGDKPRYQLNDFRHDIWNLIKDLCQDSAESQIVQDVSQEDPRAHDYLNLGINSSRGKAVESALDYAHWVANHIKVTKEKQETIPDGFNSMPEVRKMLDWLIEGDNRSVTTMSIIGSRMGLIYWIDKDWLAETAETLFHLKGIEQSPRSGEGWAAWNAFLVWVRPHVEYYRVFASQFAYAVEQAAKVDLTELSHEQPMLHLGEHLMIVFGRGHLGLDDDGGLLQEFLENAKPDIRRHAIGFVGQSLEGDAKAPEETIDHFKSLWEVYWKGPGRQDAEERHGALLFGTWFVSKQFPDDWALEQLEDFVQVDPTPEPDHLIGRRLGDIADVDVLKSVRILRQLVHGDQEGWRIYGWRDSARSILEQAMITPGEAHREAEQLINYLGRRGYSEYGKLLTTS